MTYTLFTHFSTSSGPRSLVEIENHSQILLLRFSKPRKFSGFESSASLGSSPLRGSPLAATRLALAALRPQRFAATRQIAVEKERERKEGREERRSCIRYPLLLYCRRRFVRGSIYRFMYVEKERGGGDRDPGFWRIIGRGYDPG